MIAYENQTRRMNLSTMIRLQQNNGSVGSSGDRTHQIATTLPFFLYTSTFQLTINNTEINESPLNYLTLQIEKSE